MTKEELLALKPYPKRKINSQWPVPEVSVEAKKVILQNFDKQKKDAKMDLYPYYPDDCEEVYIKEDEEEVDIKRVRKL